MKSLSTGRFNFPVAGAWDIPVMKRQKLNVKEIIGFNYVMSTRKRKRVVHFFLDDHEFVRVWNFPNRYAMVLYKFAGCFTPDFSLWRDMSRAVQVYNTYRNRYVGSFWQSQGIKVIPSVGWSDEESFEFCFSGIEKGSRVATSTRGVARDIVAMKLFKQGFDEMRRQIEPELIYMYGSQKRIDKKFDLGENVIWLSDGDLHF